MEEIVLVGFGGHAKSVADSIEREGKYNIIGYTDLQKADSRYSYLGTDDELQAVFDSGIKNAAIGLGYMGKGVVRQQIYAKLKDIGFSLPVIADPSSIISTTAVIGEGTFVGKGAIVNAEANIGKMVIINTKALVEHECVVDDFSHVAVGTVLCGQVKVGKAVFIGANATVIQGVSVSQNAIIGANCTVLRDLEDNRKYYGVKNPRGGYSYPS
ncbi:MAG: acetyltransferase [Anaerovibrio sp.]|uniref:acetyltransferase n=1 Tax=Anaerovibrio sp. TaxID=1872532 RepID=UPI001B1CDF6B|nr:acetyltransferase [Anaerovibrio sp.]MBO6246254.1 acetyltransferase [Anaerovibrio sp.]